MNSNLANNEVLPGLGEGVNKKSISWGHVCKHGGGGVFRTLRTCPQLIGVLLLPPILMGSTKIDCTNIATTTKTNIFWGGHFQYDAFIDIVLINQYFLLPCLIMTIPSRQIRPIHKSRVRGHAFCYTAGVMKMVPSV